MCGILKVCFTFRCSFLTVEVCVPTYLHEYGTYMTNDVAVFLNVYSIFVMNLVNLTLKLGGIQMNIQNPIPTCNVENGDILWSICKRDSDYHTKNIHAKGAAIYNSQDVGTRDH